MRMSPRQPVCSCYNASILHAAASQPDSQHRGTRQVCQWTARSPGCRIVWSSNFISTPNLPHLWPSFCCIYCAHIVNYLCHIDVIIIFSHILLYILYPCHFCHLSCMYTVATRCAAAGERVQCHHTEGGSCVGDLSQFQAPLLLCGLLPGGVSALYSKYGTLNISLYIIVTGVCQLPRVYIPTVFTGFGY